MPYASYNSVTFAAEQVSHHPPGTDSNTSTACLVVHNMSFCAVSAFYAECLPKRMYVTGSVHTKIKFLGLSVGVYNTASGKTYTQTFSHNFRSISFHLMHFLIGPALKIVLPLTITLRLPYVLIVMNNDKQLSAQVPVIPFLSPPLQSSYISWTMERSTV